MWNKFGLLVALSFLIFALPAQAQTVLTGTVTISAVATDDVGVTHVQFFINGVALGPELTTAGPDYSVLWDTTQVPNGNYTLSVTAKDAATNEASDSVVSAVNNTDTVPPNVEIFVTIANP